MESVKDFRMNRVAFLHPLEIFCLGDIIRIFAARVLVMLVERLTRQVASFLVNFAAEQPAAHDFKRLVNLQRCPDVLNPFKDFLNNVVFATRRFFLMTFEELLKFQ